MSGGTARQAVTLHAAQRALARRLAAAGIETGSLDARLLVAHATGLAPERLLLDGGADASFEVLHLLDDLAARRLAGEPVARIVAEKEFWSLPFRLVADTLVPRPDTETLVEAALAWLGGNEAGIIVDLGTGSGAILTALLHERRHLTGIGTDLSQAALETARANADMNGVGARAAFVRADWGASLAGPVDLVVANPPYIPHAEIASLSAETRNDPARALDGGADGLDAYRALVPQARSMLRPGGALLVEIGAGQETAVRAILSRAGFAAPAAHRDLGGIVRVVGGTA